MSLTFNYFVCTIILSFVLASAARSYQNTTFNSTGVECDVCQFVVQETEGLLLTNKTLSNIQSELDSLCQKTKYDTLCENVVNTYLPKIIEFLEQEESPQKVCQQISLC